MTVFIVQTADFTRALRAAVLFAGKDPENDMWHRVRVDVGPVNVQVFATNGYAAGLAIASVQDHADDVLEPFDLSPAQVKDVLTLFPLMRNMEEEQLLEVSLSGVEHFTVRDVSGLFPGKTVKLPRLPGTVDGEADPVGKIPHLLGRTVAATGKHYLDGVLVTAPDWVALFAKAAQVYKEQVCLTPYSDDSGRGRLLATAGESFIGTLLGWTGHGTGYDDDLVSKQVAHRDAWQVRLPVPAAASDPAVDLSAALSIVRDDADGPHGGEEADDDH